MPASEVPTNVSSMFDVGFMCEGRWLNKEGRSSHMGSWLPFSAGPRKCIGYNFALQEVKVSDCLALDPPPLPPYAACDSRSLYMGSPLPVRKPLYHLLHGRQ